MATKCGESEYVAAPYLGFVKFEDEWVELGKTMEGFEIEVRHYTDTVRSQAFGRGTMDALYMGGDCYVSAVFENFNNEGLQDLLHFWSGPDGEVGEYGGNGCKASVFACELAMVAQTPYKDWQNIQDEYRFPRVMPDPAFVQRYKLNSRLRIVPFRFQALPANIGSESAPIWAWYHTLDDDPPLQASRASTSKPASSVIVI